MDRLKFEIIIIWNHLKSKVMYVHLLFDIRAETSVILACYMASYSAIAKVPSIITISFNIQTI